MRAQPIFRAMALGLGIAGGLGVTAQDAAAQPRNCIDTLAGLPNYSRFVNAVTQASMVNDLRNLQNVTIFAPNNAAIEQVAPTLVDRIFPRDSGTAQREADPVLAGAAMQAHVVQGRMPAAALAAGMSVHTMAGTPLTTAAAPGAERTVTVTAMQGVTARVVQADIPCANGVIQGIDRVLIR